MAVTEPGHRPRRLLPDDAQGRVAKGEGRTFHDFDEVVLALRGRGRDARPRCACATPARLINLETHYDNQDVLHGDIEDGRRGLIQTTVGRVIFNDAPARGDAVHQRPAQEAGLQDLVDGFCYRKHGHEMTVKMLDTIKEVAFHYATRAGVSIGIDDMLIPSTKTKLLDDANKEVNKIEKQRVEGVITDGERYNKIIDIWHRSHREGLRRDVPRDDRRSRTTRAEFNPIFG